MKNLLNSLAIIKIRDRLQLDDKKLTFVIIGCLLIFAFLDFRFFIRLQLNALKKLDPQIVKVKNDLDALNKGLAVMRDSSNKHAQADKEIALKVKKIVTEDELPSLLQSISEMAKYDNVKITLLKPSREIQKAGNKAAAEKTSSLLITLNLLSDYYHLVKFINDLENAEVFMAVQNIRIFPEKSNYFKQEADLVIKTYVRK